MKTIDILKDKEIELGTIGGVHIHVTPCFDERSIPWLVVYTKKDGEDFILHVEKSHISTRPGVMDILTTALNEAIFGLGSVGRKFSESDRTFVIQKLKGAITGLTGKDYVPRPKRGTFKKTEVFEHEGKRYTLEIMAYGDSDRLNYRATYSKRSLTGFALCYNFYLPEQGNMTIKLDELILPMLKEIHKNNIY